MFNIGPAELLVVLLIALLVLGPTKLPDAARQVGRALGELRRLSSGFQAEMRDALKEPVEGTPTGSAGGRGGADTGDAIGDDSGGALSSPRPPAAVSVANGDGGSPAIDPDRGGAVPADAPAAEPPPAAGTGPDSNVPPGTDAGSATSGAAPAAHDAGSNNTAPN